MGRKPSSDKRRLTAAKVQQEKKPGKYYDENGLFLRVTQNGAKSWVQRITISGRQREVGLGSASLVSLAEARELARDNKRVAASGVDPALERKRRTGMPTFEEAAKEVYSLHRPTWRNAKHAAQFLSTLAQYTYPVFGSRKVSDVTSADVMRALLPVWTKKPETARRVKQRIGVVMKWAIAQGYRLDDPSNAIEQALPRMQRQPKHRRSIHYDDVSACLATVQASSATVPVKLGIEFLVLTAARSGEVRLAEWAEVDLERAVWTVPAERMKGNIEHVVPLSERAVAILRKARKLHDGELIFPGTKAGRPISDMTFSKLIKELGYQADVHGFRTSFRVWVQERTNASFEVAEKALAHKTKNKVVAAYARSDLFEQRRALMQRWADHLNQRSSNVVHIGGVA